MKELMVKLGEDGRVLIPAPYRKLLHFTPGETLVLHIDNNELRLMSLKHSIKDAQYVVQQHVKKQSLVNYLISMRREDEIHD